MTPRRAWLWAVVLGAWCVLAPVRAARAEPVALSELRHMDRVRVLLSAGGVLDGTVGEVRGDVLVLVQGSSTQEVPAPVIASIDLLERPLQRSDRPGVPAGIQPLPGARSRGALLLSLVWPGLGHFALGKGGPGAAFLVTDLVVAGVAVGAFVLNEDPLTGGLLIGVDVALRVASGIAAYRLGREPRLVVGVVPGPRGGVVAVHWTLGGAPQRRVAPER